MHRDKKSHFWSIYTCIMVLKKPIYKCNNGQNQAQRDNGVTCMKILTKKIRSIPYKRHSKIQLDTSKLGGTLVGH